MYTKKFSTYISLNMMRVIPTHQQLAELGREAHELAAAYVAAHPPQQELSGMHLGRRRTDIKKHLAPKMKEIDKLVKKVIG